MSNIDDPICCLVGFSIDMLDIPRDKKLKKSLNVFNDVCHLSRRVPDAFYRIDN